MQDQEKIVSILPDSSVGIPAKGNGHLTKHE
jgi:hypothetical protein